MSTLSLCIPAYNAAWCLPRLLESAKKQAIAFNEILIYDDCSTDGTAAVGREYGATVIRGDKRNWNPIGKNKLAAVAKSEWLFFIDADDELLPNFSVRVRKWMEQTNPSDIILIPYRHVHNTTGDYLGDVYYDREQLLTDPVKFTITTKIVNFELIRKEPFNKIGGFDVDPKVLFIEDRAFAFKAALNGLKFNTEDEIICNKYFTKTSMSSANLDKCWEDAYHLWEKVFNSVGDKYVSEIVYQLHENAVWAAKAEAWGVVRKSLILAKKINPNLKPGGSKGFLAAYNLLPFASFYVRAKALKLLGKERL